jgi:hypothetical protein
MNIPVFDALTGDLRYIFKLNIEGNRFRIPLYTGLTASLDHVNQFRKIEVWLIDMGWQNRQSWDSLVKCKTCLADRALLDALDGYPDDELPSYIQRLL